MSLLERVLFKHMQERQYLIYNVIVESKRYRFKTNRKHMTSVSFEIAKRYLGKHVEVIIDRPFGTKHPKHGFLYEVNYGFIDGVRTPDGEDLDAYYLGINYPVNKARGTCVAIAHRSNDDDDKLIVMPEGIEMEDEEIMKAILFQEKWFKTTIVRSGSV